MLQACPLRLKPTVARWREAMSQSVLREVLALADREGVLSFAIGLPAGEFFPAAELGAAATRLLHADRRALQYGVPSFPLKQQIVELMALRGVSCRPEEIFLTTGAQQGMDLLSRLLVERGSPVILERVVYDGMQMAVKKLAPEILTVPTDPATGIDVDAVEEILEAGADHAFLYLITDGHNPLGVSVSREKRVQLADLARRHHLPIIEDDAYGFLFFEETAPPVRALDAEWILYLGSFSKILAPALRAGWVVVPEPLTAILSALKHSVDLDTPSFTHHVISEYLRSGALSEHLAVVRCEYRRRRDVLCAALSRQLADIARWSQPAGGMFLWLELPSSIDTAAGIATAIERFQVAFSPGRAFSVTGDDHARSCIRLAFANLAPDEIEEGVDRLARYVRWALH
jgi:2-aminoadipate transaminase